MQRIQLDTYRARISCRLGPQFVPHHFPEPHLAPPDSSLGHLIEMRDLHREPGGGPHALRGKWLPIDITLDHDIAGIRVRWAIEDDPEPLTERSERERGGEFRTSSSLHSMKHVDLGGRLEVAEEWTT